MKADSEAIGLRNVARIVQAVDIPVVAIGGIGEGNVGEVVGTGVAGVALVSALFDREDVEAATRSMAKGIEAAALKMQCEGKGSL